MIKKRRFSYSKTDGWLYGDGRFSLTSHDKSVVGLFIWMENSAHEGGRLGQENGVFANLLDVVCMDSKADDEKMSADLRDKYGIKLLTVPRKEMDKSERRQKMIAEQIKEENRLIYRSRGVMVEPMQ